MADVMPIMQPVFTDAAGQPMVFYIDPLDPQRDKYLRIIHSAGGIVETNDRVLQRNDVAQLSSFPWNDRITISFAFVDDLIKKGQIAYIEDYRYDAGLAKKGLYDDSMDAASAVAHALAKKLKMTKTTKKFTPEADAYILDQVRMKPRFRTLHKFFEELAQHSLLKGHTGNSVRSRFRAHLEHKLQYVFKTDDFDNLVLDEEGNRIPIPVNLAKTIKNRFSADDDYHLCDDIINHVLSTQDPEQLKYTDGYKDTYLNENKFSVLILFFDDYARHNPHHLLLSWRDRYRKFARVYGLQKYRDYYLREMKSKDGPQPMKNLTSRALKEKKKLENNVRRMKKAHDDAEVAAAAAVAVTNLLPDHVNPLPIDASAAAAVANLAVAARDEALDEEIGGVKNSNIHEALRNVGAQAGRVNIDDDMMHQGVRALAHLAIHPSLLGTVVLDDDYEMEMKVDADLQDPYARDMNYLSRDSPIEDILLVPVYELPSDIVDVASVILLQQAPEDIGSVYKQFEDLGLTRRFTGHMFKVTGANVKYLHDYMQFFFRGLDKGVKLPELIFPQFQNGMWTPEYDLYLRTGKYTLLRFQEEESLQARRAFLGLDE